MADVQMSEKELRDLVRTTVLETLEALGADVENPLEQQRDFQALRDWRKSSQTVKSTGLAIALGVFVPGLLAMMWLGFKDFIRLP